MKNSTVYGKDHETVIADSFDILVDTDKRRGPVIGIKVDPRDGEPFIMPVAYTSAKALSEMILATLLDAAPELFADQLKRKA